MALAFGFSLRWARGPPYLFGTFAKIAVIRRAGLAPADCRIDGFLLDNVASIKHLSDAKPLFHSIGGCKTRLTGYVDP
jgi:hypothetical protein